MSLRERERREKNRSHEQVATVKITVGTGTVESIPKGLSVENYYNGVKCSDFRRRCCFAFIYVGVAAIFPIT